RESRPRRLARRLRGDRGNSRLRQVADRLGARPKFGTLLPMRIYTKTGDAGETGLFGGGRVQKDDPRVESYGALDELNAGLGSARAAGLSPEIDAIDRKSTRLNSSHQIISY